MDAEPAEDHLPKETNEDKDASTSIQDEKECTSTTPGSGVWEKSENRRWVVVMDTNHRIPSRNRTRSEGSLDPSLSIHSFVSRFEVEEQQPGNYNVVSDGSSLVRIDRVGDLDEDTAGQEQEEDPMEGTSGSQTRRVNARARRQSSHLSSPEHIPPPPSDVETVQSRGRRKRRQRRKKKVFLLSGNFIGRKKKWKREVILSVESSPGRDSPSPDTLRRIVERGLVVEREEMKTVDVEEVVEEEARLKVSNSLDKIDNSKESDADDIPRD